MMYYFRTQDIVEFKERTEVAEEPKLIGYLQKRDPSGPIKGWKRRFFLLKNLRLYYSISEKEIEKPIAFIDLKQTFTVAPLPHINEKVFSMATIERTYYLQADTVEEMKMWISGFNELMKYKKQTTKDNSWIREIETSEREGFMTKMGNRLKTWKRRFFVMRDGFLYYYRSHNGGQEMRGAIPLYNCKIEISREIPIEQLGFQIITAIRSYHVYADTDRETQEWMDAITKHKITIESQVDSILL